MMVMREGSGAPGEATHDASAGYFKRCFYLDTSTGQVYLCIDATVGAAIWKLIG